MGYLTDFLWIKSVKNMSHFYSMLKKLNEQIKKSDDCIFSKLLVFIDGKLIDGDLPSALIGFDDIVFSVNYLNCQMIIKKSKNFPFEPPITIVIIDDIELDSHMIRENFHKLWTPAFSFESYIIALHSEVSEMLGI